MSRADRLIPMIDDALFALEIEISKAISGEIALDSHNNLEFMQNRLLEMKKFLASNVREGDRYKGSMTHIITDSWIDSSNLGRDISNIEYLYYR